MYNNDITASIAITAIMPPNASPVFAFESVFLVSTVALLVVFLLSSTTTFEGVSVVVTISVVA